MIIVKIKMMIIINAIAIKTYDDDYAITQYKNQQCLPHTEPKKQSVVIKERRKTSFHYQ